MQAVIAPKKVLVRVCRIIGLSVVAEKEKENVEHSARVGCQRTGYSYEVKQYRQLGGGISLLKGLASKLLNKFIKYGW